MRRRGVGVIIRRRSQKEIEVVQFSGPEARAKLAEADRRFLESGPASLRCDRELLLQAQKDCIRAMTRRNRLKAALNQQQNDPLERAPLLRLLLDRANESVEARRTSYNDLLERYGRLLKDLEARK